MSILRLPVTVVDLQERIRLRLCGGNKNVGSTLVWTEDGESVLLYLNSMTLRLVSGWMICQLDLFTDSTQRKTLQFLYFLGKEDDGNSPKAGARTLFGDAMGAQLAERWGGHLQRVVWDGVLDVIEGAFNFAEQLYPKNTLELMGFFCTESGITVDVSTGGA